MNRGLWGLVLLTDGFGGLGGIAKFNRDFLEALDGSGIFKRVVALPRLIPQPIAEATPQLVVYDHKAARGKMAFLSRLTVHALWNSRIDLVICGHIHLLPAAWLVTRLRGARLILIIHGLEAWTPSHKYLAKWFARRVDAFIAVSKYSAERFTKWSGVSMNRAFILPNCVDLQKFRPQGRDPTLIARHDLKSSKVILTVGRLVSEDRYKGFDPVIEVMPELIRRFGNLKYMIVGDGPDRQRLEAKVDGLGLANHVIFAGYVPESEKPAYYNLADVYAMPSRGEGFGIVLLEAAACGVPIVGSQVDGSREALLDGKLGQLVDPGDRSQLIQTITKTLEDGSSRLRSELIENFATEAFKARVHGWCCTQMHEVFNY
jgi:phosphatidylinositol alpha-1,6-mannosyltransferase